MKGSRWVYTIPEYNSSGLLQRELLLAHGSVTLAKPKDVGLVITDSKKLNKSNLIRFIVRLFVRSSSTVFRVELKAIVTDWAVAAFEGVPTKFICGVRPKSNKFKTRKFTAPADARSLIIPPILLAVLVMIGEGSPPLAANGSASEYMSLKPPKMM